MNLARECIWKCLTVEPFQAQRPLAGVAKRSLKKVPYGSITMAMIQDSSENNLIHHKIVFNIVPS